MTAPCEEVVEQRSDSDSLLHLWCLRCLRPSPLPNKAACGFTTTERGWGGPGDKCVVCLDLEGTPCRGCGWEL